MKNSLADRMKEIKQNRRGCVFMESKKRTGKIKIKVQLELNCNCKCVDSFIILVLLGHE